MQHQGLIAAATFAVGVAVLTLAVSLAGKPETPKTAFATVLDQERKREDRMFQWIRGEPALIPSPSREVLPRVYPVADSVWAGRPSDFDALDLPEVVTTFRSDYPDFPWSRVTDIRVTRESREIILTDSTDGVQLLMRQSWIDRTGDGTQELWWEFQQVSVAPLGHKPKPFQVALRRVGS